MFRSSLNLKLLVVRKVISLLVLGCLLLASIPLPMGFKLVHRSVSTPFPCMDCACGCATPEQCWTACCCFTPAERERWAEQHGVTPPSYAVLSSTATSRPAAVASQQTACSGALCSESLCSSISNETSMSRGSHACGECDKLSAADADVSNSCTDSADGQCSAAAEAVTVISVVALRCQGASSEFTLLPWAIVNLHTCDVCAPQVNSEPYRVISETAVCLGIAPATPPPIC